MWRFNQLGRRARRPPSYDIPILPYGRAYYAVIDVEALVLGKVDMVEQVGIVLVDVFGQEVLGEKHMIYQPLNAAQLATAYNIEPEIVKKGVDGYVLVTQDVNYVHSDPNIYEIWGQVRKRIVQICNTYAIAVYAKGIDLEYRVFFGELPFWDLAWYGASKYPVAVHDPLCECRFFKQFIPDLITRPVYIC